MQVLALAVLILLCSGCVGSQKALPLARNGVIHLPSIDILQIDPISLDGEWEFYWNRLLTPDDFHRPHPPVMSGYLSLPGSWNRFRIDGKALGGGGYATFRLRVLPPNELHGELALRLGYLVSAYRLWADGHLIAKGGVIGTDTSGEIPNQHIQLARLPVSGRPVELVLQISNFHYSNGGPVTSIELGIEGRLLTKQLLKWGIAFLCSGAMLVMGVYHLVLFCFRPKNTAPLYFGLLFLLWMVLQLTSPLSDWCANLLLGDIPVWFLNRFDVVCFIFSVPVGYTFFRTLYPKEFPRRIQQATWSLTAIFVLLSLILTTLTFTSLIAAYYIFATIVMLYSLIRLFAALRRKRQGILFILLGFALMTVSGVNDMLYDMQLIQSVYMTHIGMFLFISFQSFALSLLYSRSFSAVEQLSDELTDKNVALEQEMAERTRLEREVVNVSEEERRSISQDLHDGLCQLLTGARLHLSALRRKMAGAGTQIPDLVQLSSLLEASVNQAYDLSRGLWPLEHAPDGNTLSLRELTRRLSESSGIAIEFRQQRGCPKCSNIVMTQLFRIAQEAVTNAIKHARPGRITVGLDCTDRKVICLTVHDNGIGRNDRFRTPGGLGQKIMAHRARIIGGTLTVAAGKAGGTLVTCTAPCEAHSTEDSNP